MGKIEFYIQDCNDEELKEFLKEAKAVANIVHRKVTIHTATEVYEVNEDEKEQEEKDKVVKHPQEKFESW